ncbi:MAG: adenylate/guanylate cyclase domain-containing protein [Actinomycetota bacterium]
MSPVHLLKRLLSQPEILEVLQALARGIDAGFSIQSVDGQLLLGAPSNNKQPLQFPVEATGEVIGWIFSHKDMAAIAQLLSYLAERELEKKALVKEVLDKYREFTFFYNFSQKLTGCLEVHEIGMIVVAEIKRLIPATNISMMLLDAENHLNVIAAFGNKSDSQVLLSPGLGIAGSVMQNGIPEIINEVSRDPRFIVGDLQISSLICAPLKTQEEAIGVINISSEEPAQYTAQDLKVATGIAGLTAAALENLLLHQNKLKEERIKSQLERYIPSQLVNAIITAKEGDISLAPAKKQIAVLFSDIRNFTAKCEELPPETIVGYLNEYFTQMVEVIFNHQGTVNKFVGDMIVAMFGAPAKLVDNEKQAIAAAIGMQLRLRTIPVPWIRDNFLTGIGISSGDVVVGNIGSPHHLDYTAIGDEVNLASRLQGIAQGGQILVSQAVYEAAQDSFTFREYGCVTVKGKRQSVDVFEVLY